MIIILIELSIQIKLFINLSETENFSLKNSLHQPQTVIKFNSSIIMSSQHSLNYYCSVHFSQVIWFIINVSKLFYFSHMHSRQSNVLNSIGQQRNLHKSILLKLFSFLFPSMKLTECKHSRPTNF